MRTRRNRFGLEWLVVVGKLVGQGGGDGGSRNNSRDSLGHGHSDGVVVVVVVGMWWYRAVPE